MYFKLSQGTSVVPKSFTNKLYIDEQKYRKRGWEGCWGMTLGDFSSLSPGLRSQGHWKTRSGRVGNCVCVGMCHPEDVYNITCLLTYLLYVPTFTLLVIRSKD